jgi:tetratricopeptide (TPR) repeat protein
MRSLALVFFLAACASSSPSPSESVVAPSTPAQASSPPPAEPSAPDVAPPVAARPFPQAFRAYLLDSASGSSDPDAALFRQANERELAGDYASARRTFFDLIKNFPNSTLVPYAYLAFADLFFDEAEKDVSKWPLASQAYDKVITYPPPKNLAYAYALHRRGLVAAHTGDGASALSNQKNALAAAVRYPELPLATETADAARKALVVAYAEVGEPGKAFAFFRTADASGASALIVALSEEYVRRGAGKEARTLYDDALAHGPSSEVCASAASAAKALDAPFGAEIERARKARCP